MTFSIAALFSAACGGGGAIGPGGGGGGGSPPPVPSPSPAWRPAAAGDTFAFSGTETQRIVRSVPTPTPPPVTTNFTVSQTTTVQSSGCSSGTDFHTVEIDAGANQTTTVTTDSCFTFPAAGTGPVIETRSTSADSNGVNLTQTFGAGNGQVDQLPEALGQTWDNGAAGTLNGTNPDGSTATQTTNPDGSYIETDMNIAGTTTIAEKNDLSGTETAPTTAFFGCGTATMFAVATPNPSGIPITVSSVGCAPAPTPAPQSFVLTPNWYPVPPNLASDMTSDMGSSSIPTGCASTAFGTAGNDLHEVKTRLDTVLGDTDKETIDTWVAFGPGPLCVQLTDVFKIYYDFTGQTTQGIFSPTPQQTTTTMELIGLQTETLHSVDRRPLSDGRAAQQAQVFAARVALAEANIERMHGRWRMKQIHDQLKWLSKGALR